MFGKLRNWLYWKSRRNKKFLNGWEDGMVSSILLLSTLNVEISQSQLDQYFSTYINDPSYKKKLGRPAEVEVSAIFKEMKVKYGI